MVERDLISGADVGTTSIKAGLFNAEGRPIAHDGRQLPRLRARPQGSWSKTHATGLTASLRQWITFTGDRAERIAAVGLSSQVKPTYSWTPTAAHLPLRSCGRKPRRPAKPRARSRGLGRDKMAWWGAPLPIGASHVLARMMWMARERPDVYAATCHVLTPKIIVYGPWRAPLSLIRCRISLSSDSTQICRSVDLRVLARVNDFAPLKFLPMSSAKSRWARPAARPSHGGYNGRLEWIIRGGRPSSRTGRVHERYE